MTQTTNIKASELAYYQELLSALIDGELGEKELSDLLHVFRQQDELSVTLLNFWSRICLSKRVLKREVGLQLEQFYANSSDFKKLQQQLQAEPVPAPLKSNVHVLAPVRLSGLQNFSIAASVMFAVVFAWLFAQAPVREAVVMALFSEDTEAVQYIAEHPQQIAEQNAQMIPRFNYSRQAIPVSAGNLGQAGSGIQASVHAQQGIHLSDKRMAGYMSLHSQAQPWQASWLPQGFFLVGMNKRAATSDDAQLELLTYSNGASAISIFIEPVSKPASFNESSQKGVVSAYSQGFKHAGQGYMITAMGDVPLQTLERVVKGVSYQTK